eukprot:364273-Chlamydomonas_euryale.AAC.7
MEANIEKDKNFERLMRGHVPEWDDNYIEKIVPSHIIQALDNEKQFIDDEGYTWSYRCFSACKIKSTGQSVVVVASKYLGQGYHDLKIVTSPTSPVLKIPVSMIGSWTWTWTQARGWTAIGAAIEYVSMEKVFEFSGELEFFRRTGVFRKSLEFSESLGVLRSRLFLGGTNRVLRKSLEFSESPWSFEKAVIGWSGSEGSGPFLEHLVANIWWVCPWKLHRSFWVASTCTGLPVTAWALTAGQRDSVAGQRDSVAGQRDSMSAWRYKFTHEWRNSPFVFMDHEHLESFRKLSGKKGSNSLCQVP